MKISYKSLLIAGTFFSAMLASLPAHAVQIQTDNNGMTIAGLGVASDGGAFLMCQSIRQTILQKDVCMAYIM